MEGTVIGSYRVLRKLGEGGMGAVYVAEHSLIGRKAAIKVLLPTLSAHQDIVQRFFNEARAATAIADPGIVQIFDFGYHSDGSAFIVMEYLEGETLDARLRRFGRLAPFDAVRILRQVASSLQSAHARGIVHRDLKPENIFLVRDVEVAGGERAKILDFGIAKLTGDGDSKVKTSTSAIMGTPTFMSPEQCRGAGQVDHRSDIYAMGCVLFALVTGAPPFDGEGAGDIIAAHLMTAPPAPSSRVPGIPASIDQVVMRCLAKSPDHRYGTMDELAAVLGQVMNSMTAPGALGPAGPGGPYPGYQTPPAQYPPHGTGSSGPWNGPGAAGVPPSTPTTLSSVASQVNVTAQAPKSRGLGIAIAAIAVAAAAAVGVVLVTRGGDEPQPAKQPPVADPKEIEPEPKPEPEVQPEPPKPEPEVQPEPPKPEIAEPEPPKPEVVEPEPPRPPEEKKSTRKKKKKKTGGSGVPGDTDGDGIPDER